ncbi:MAG: hypothetical protein ACOZNI_36585 [Myxococcota bacterium]
MTTAGLWLLGAGLLLSWANSALHVLLSDRPFYLLSARLFDGRVRAARAAVLAVLSLGYGGLVVAFVRAGASERLAVAILACLVAIRQWEIAQWQGDLVVRLGKYVPTAACLAGWLVAQPILRASGVGEGEAWRLGWDAACGVMAGVYVLAGIAKLRESGPEWAKARHQALLVAERAYFGPRPLRALRLAVARSRASSAVVGAVGLGLELGAVAFLVPSLRPGLAGAIVAMHLGFFVLLGYVELEWTVVLLAITLLAGAR